MNNNIPLIIKKNAGCQYIYFSIMFLGGTVIENETNVGITHLLEHLLLSMKADDNLSIFLIQKEWIFVGKQLVNI